MLCIIWWRADLREEAGFLLLCDPLRMLPLLIAFPCCSLGAGACAQDVIHTVCWARSHGLALSVLGGGHDFAGRALCDDGIVIDCSLMRAVSIDPAARTAHIQG